MDTRTILNKIDHRPYPLPKGSWIMTQVWRDLLFAHWPIPVEQMRPLVPAELHLDTFDGQAWVGIVPFHMTDVRLRGTPYTPYISRFFEMNVRTYVSVNGIGGVYFFSLDANSPLAVLGARRLFALPYYNAIMSGQRKGEEILYQNHRNHRGVANADFTGAYKPVAPAFPAAPGSIEHWLTERYSLYTVVRHRVYRGDIHHPQWSLQPAALTTEIDTMGVSHGIQRPGTAPLLQYAQTQEVIIWPLHRIFPL